MPLVPRACLSARTAADTGARGAPAILCGEWGTPDGERWSEPADLSPEDRRAVALHEQNRLLESRPAPAPRAADWSDAPLFAPLAREGEASRLQIAGTDHVGCLVLPSGRQVRIRPKVGGLTVLDWLAYLGECPPVAGWLRDSANRVYEGGSLEGGLAALFLGELETLTRLHLRKQYVASRRESATVRGKVLPSALVRRYHRLPAVPQRSPDRTWDTPAHAVLVAALDRVTRFTDDPNPPAGLSEAWASIRRPPPEVVPRLLHDCRQAPPPGYAPALQLAALVLQGVSQPNPRPAAAPSAPGPSFLLSLAGVWERALRRMCRELSKETGWSPAPDAQRTRRWHDGSQSPAALRPPSAPRPNHREEPRWMTADALLESATQPRERWVLDAKYKCGYGDEDRSDRFQAAAYAIAFDASRGSLVYPTAAGAARRRLLLAGEVAGRRVTIDSLELPMSVGPQACRAALGELIRTSHQESAAGSRGRQGDKATR